MLWTVRSVFMNVLGFIMAVGAALLLEQVFPISTTPNGCTGE